MVRELVRKATHSENQMNQNHRRQRPNHARHRLNQGSGIKYCRLNQALEPAAGS